jgi:hypothetical protein
MVVDTVKWFYQVMGHPGKKRLQERLNQCYYHPKLKEYAQVEGVLAKLGVASESAVDLSCRNGVPEMAEYCEKVPLSFARPHVDLVPGGNGTGTCLTHADT